MADISKILEGVIGGLLAGGISGGSGVVAYFRDLKKRLADLEAKLGTSEPKTGIYLALWMLEEPLKKIHREMDSWEDDPPEWAKRLLSRSRVSSSTDLGQQVEFEGRIMLALRQYNDRIKRIEDDFDSKIDRIERDVERHISEGPDGKMLTRAEYVADSRERAAEMLKLRQELATANGLLRGVMSGLGYLELGSESKG